jgi:hypothetical protein
MSKPIAIYPKMAKQYVFWFHWNKHKKKPSVVYRGKHYFPDNVECQAPTKSVRRKTQPYFIMKGKAAGLYWNKNTLIISWLSKPKPNVRQN